MDISVLTSILTGGDEVMRMVPDTGAVSNSTIGKTSHSQTNKAPNDADNRFAGTLEEKMSNKKTTESESTQIPVEKKPNDRAINTQQEPQAQASPTAPQTSQGLSQQTENTAMENPQGIENTELNAQSEGANALAEQETAQIVTPLAAQAETAENTQLIATEFIPAATSLQPSDAQAAVVPDTPAVAVDQPTPSDNTQQLPTENTSQTIPTPADQPATGTESAPETESASAILQNDPKVLTAQQAKTPQNSTLKANTTPETGTTTPTESIKPQMQQLNPTVQPVPDDTPVPKTDIPAEKTETTGLVTIATEDNTQPAEPAIARPLDAMSFDEKPKAVPQSQFTVPQLQTPTPKTASQPESALPQGMAEELTSYQIKTSDQPTKPSTTASLLADSDLQSVKFEQFTANVTPSTVPEHTSASTAVEKPVVDIIPNDISTSITEQVRTSITDALQNGNQQLTVQLNPPELGELSIKFTQQGDQITGVLEVAKLQTMYEIQQSMPQLLQDLAEGGIQVKRIEVVLSNTGQSDHQPFKYTSQANQQDTWTDQQYQPEREAHSDGPRTGRWIAETKDVIGLNQYTQTFATDTSINMFA